MRKFNIGGRWVAAKSNAEHVVIDPSTEQATGAIYLANRLDVDAAVSTANAAFLVWSAADPGD